VVFLMPFILKLELPDCTVGDLWVIIM